jgi:hypothetical protein
LEFLENYEHFKLDYNNIYEEILKRIKTVDDWVLFFSFWSRNPHKVLRNEGDIFEKFQKF